MPEALMCPSRSREVLILHDPREIYPGHPRDRQEPEQAVTDMTFEIQYLTR